MAELRTACSLVAGSQAERLERAIGRHHLAAWADDA
jgi:hypothetical protein